MHLFYHWCTNHKSDAGPAVGSWELMDFWVLMLGTYRILGRKSILCDVENAETTLNDYKDFLKTDKYKEWNDQQEDKYKDSIKEMIGKNPFVVQ